MKKLTALFFSILIHTIIIASAILAYIAYKPNRLTQNDQDKKLKIKLTCFVATKQQKHKISMPHKKEKKDKKIKSKPHRKKRQNKRLDKQLKKIIKKKSTKKTKKSTYKQKPKQTTQSKPINMQPVSIGHPKQIKTTNKQTNLIPKPTKSSTRTYMQTYLINNLDRIRTLIKENLYYPRKARRRKIEGIVKLSFKLTKTGKIKQVKILSNSPKILIDASIKTLQTLNNQLPPPKEDIKITLPIVYKIDKF